jgi:hypothetical protein
MKVIIVIGLPKCYNGLGLIVLVLRLGLNDNLSHTEKKLHLGLTVLVLR